MKCFDSVSYFQALLCKILKYLSIFSLGTESTQVIDLPIIDNVRPRPPYVPLAIPKDLSERIIRLHGNPIVWWLSQFIKYLLRPQDSIQQLLNNIEAKLDFKHPVVGYVYSSKQLMLYFEDIFSC